MSVKDVALRRADNKKKDLPADPYNDLSTLYLVQNYQIIVMHTINSLIVCICGATINLRGWRSFMVPSRR